jgi:hypothetical protein
MASPPKTPDLKSLPECSFGFALCAGFVEFVAMSGCERIQFRIGDVLHGRRQAMINQSDICILLVERHRAP